ncbi:hypothetical protein [Cloacibacillus evryensis]|uniref:Lipoprotein n=1 Tax=Cloacibacillus evryensis TaxID=508460 RepID=A0AAW5K038_9BACT|nr:hypothetical protein [Cloacibacillus evryensis]EHL70405.1 hypothetical protein HMPREF1006_02356 [Synergistes sp. 3_1_syn1]MCQ4814185.1 hypothetical protein [Cloacibacillus evryensis]
MKNYSISAVILSMTALFFCLNALAAGCVGNEVLVPLRGRNMASSAMRGKKR